MQGRCQALEDFSLAPALQSPTLALVSTTLVMEMPAGLEKQGCLQGRLAGIAPVGTGGVWG